MKRTTGLLLFALIFWLGSCSLLLAEPGPVRVLVDGQETEVDKATRIIDDQVMVPIRWIATALKADIHWDEDSRTVQINRCPALVSLPDDKANLYPFKQAGGLYDGFILETGEKRRYFDWENSSSICWLPQLHSADLDGDGEEEIIVILIHGTGTGVHEEEVHVIRTSDLSEIAVENPLDIVQENVESSLSHEGEDVTVKIKVGDRTAVIKMKEADSGCWCDDMYFGNANHFYVRNHKLVADIAAQVSAAAFVGEVKFTYTFDGERFTAKGVEFTAYEDQYDVSYLVSEP